MSFENHAKELLRPIPFHSRGDYPEYLGTWEAQEFANINEGIAEILALLASADTRPEGGDSTQIEAPFTGGAVPHEDAADAQHTAPDTSHKRMGE